MPLGQNRLIRLPGIIAADFGHDQRARFNAPDIPQSTQRSGNEARTIGRVQKGNCCGPSRSRDGENVHRQYFRPVIRLTGCDVRP